MRSYGSSDGGKTVVNEDKELNEKMKKAAGMKCLLLLFVVFILLYHFL